MLLLAFFFLLCMCVYVGMVLRSAYHFIHIPCQRDERPALPPMVSVVVPARNEAEHLPQLLEQLLTQDFPPDRFEVILVDDASEDATRAIAWLWAERYAQLRVLEAAPPEGTVAFKKAALQTGIAAARGDIIVQTDADCYMGPDWLRTLVAHFGPNTALVSGPILLTHGPHWLERLQCLEMMGLVALGAGAMAAGRPNLVNGANLAFRKSVFEAVGGYQGIDQVASGDDELLLQKIRQLKHYEMRFARCQAAIVHTAAVPGWADLRAQRLRWVSKARHYLHRGPNVLQALAYLAFLGIPALLVMGLGEPRYAGLALELWLLKLLADLPLMLAAARFFRKLPLLKKDLLRLQLAYLPYVLWVGLVGNVTRQYHWKGRIVR